MDINMIMQQAQRMQKQMEKKQKELESKEYEVSSNGGAIVVKMLGSKKIVSLDIDEDLINKEEKEMLQDMLIVAINEASNKVDEDASKELGSISGGLKIPGMF